MRRLIGLMLLGMVAAVPAHAQTAPTQAAGAPPQVPQRFPPPGWPSPVEDTRPYTFLLADVVDFTTGSNLQWDANGWHGGDYNRLWFKSEGEQDLRKADRNLDVQVLYGRFVKKYYDVQIGGGVQTATFQARNVTRPELVFGFEGFVPFKSDFESLLFVSHKGDVRGRVTFERDLLASQRLIIQPRIEGNLAVHRVEEFGVAAGLNALEFGIRARYEIRRELAPYIGVSFSRRFFGAADLARAQGNDAGEARLVFGIRAWR